MMKHTLKYALFLAFASILFAGCQATYNAPRADVSRDSHVVFARPDQHTIFGTRNIMDYCEMVYAEMRLSPDQKTQILTVGIRNRGGQHWWNRKGPSVTLAGTASFFTRSKTSSSQEAGLNLAPVYVSGRNVVRIQRGETAHFTFLCPITTVTDFQVVFTDKI